jgi:ubiquinone/menaquinone biosynthesis C-methylase UbiE
MNPESSYLPAMGSHRLTRFYDPFIRLTVREHELKSRLIERANVESGMRVLDLGCGTGTLCIMTKQACPSATIVGLDADPEIIAIARRKAEQAQVAVEWHVGRADDPPFAPESFERIFSTLAIHHLTRVEKKNALVKAYQMLRLHGELYIADFGQPQNLLMRIASVPARMFDHKDRLAPHLKGRIPQMMKDAGFNAAEQVDNMTTIFGSLRFYRGVK